MKIDIKTIKKLAENIEKYNLEEVSIELDGTKLTLKKEAIAQMIEAAPQTIVATKAPKVTKAPVEKVAENNYEAITSPMVGTYYSTPAPGEASFVTEGMDVKVGDTLCIIEAMKLMNEVKANKSGKIMKILKTDGEGVAKGDNLFLID